MVRRIDPLRLWIGVALLALALFGLFLHGRSFGPVVFSAVGDAFEQSRDGLLEDGWASALGASDMPSFMRSCLLLNQQGCRDVFWSETWQAFRALFADRYARLTWPHLWVLCLTSLVVGIGFIARSTRRVSVFDAHFASLRDVTRLHVQPDRPATILLGKLKGHYLGLQADLKGKGRLPHTLITAPTGLGKSAHLKGVLVSWDQSAVVLDIKGELQRETSRWRQVKVGPVYTLSPEGVGSRFDPFAALMHLNPDAAEDIAHFLAYDPTDAQTFFSSQAQPALIAGIRSAQLAGVAVLPHLHELLGLGCKGFVERLAQVEDSQITESLTAFLGMPPQEFPAASFTDTRGPVFSVWQTLLERLRPFRRAGIRALMSGSDVTPEALTEPSTLYIKWPEASLDADAKPLSLILHSLITSLNQYADRRGGRLPVPILLALDEATRYSVPALPKYISTMQGRGISALLYIQSGSQFVQNYGPNHATTLTDGCRVKMYLQPELEDALRLTKQFGTVVLGSDRTSRRGRAERVVSEHEVQRPVATVDEVMRLDEDDMLLLYRGLRPVHGKRLNVYKDHTLKARLRDRPVVLLPYPEEPSAAKPATNMAQPKPPSDRFFDFDEGELG